MNISVNRDSTVPVYLQISSRIRGYDTFGTSCAGQQAYA